MGRILTKRKHNALAISFLLQALVCLRAFSVPTAPQEQQPTIHLRRVGVQVQVGTDSATAYYLQWRTPTTGWQTWTSESTIPEGINGVWFRAIFDSNPEDPMEWELAEDVDRILTPSGALDTTDDQIFWSAIGSFEQDGSFRAAYELNPDPMVKMSSDPPPLSYDQPTKNNQAVATPDPGRVKLYINNNATGLNVIWHLSDTGAFRASALSRNLNIGSAWRVAATADVNGDGTKDLVLNNYTTGQIVVWFLDADGVFNSSRLVRDLNLGSEWRVAAAADVNGNGTPDLILNNYTTGQIVVWFLNADGSFNQSVLVRDLNLGSAWRVATTADINGNGTPDLILNNYTTGQVVVWFLNADGTFNSSILVRNIYLGSAWRVLSAADTNNDGVPDLILHNSTTGQAVVWLINLNGSFDSSILVRDINLSAEWRFVSADL